MTLADLIYLCAAQNVSLWPLAAISVVLGVIFYLSCRKR